MKVGSLFAEIGFKIDDEGLKNFSNAMKAFQKSVRDGLKDLKSYAQAAKEISQAMRTAYVPNQQEARSRYRAQTAYLRSQSRTGNAWARIRNAEAKHLAAQANLANVRAQFFEQDSNTRASNARSRARQLDLKERGLIGTHNGKATFRLGNIITSVGGLLSGKFFTLVGSLFGSFGALIGRGVDALVSVIWKATTWLGKTLLQGLKMGMAYRDYRAFTGRSTTGLSKLMAGTFNTSSMRPEDVLKDALGMETQFWDMWFGGGNPRLWQLLGVMPTGQGETDLQNIINRIGDVTNGFENVGLARSLFKMAGLSEDYINVARYNAKKNQTDIDLEVERLMSNAERYEEANVVIKQFSWELDALKGEITAAFVQNGGLDSIKELFKVIKDNIPIIVQAISVFAKGVSKVMEIAVKFGETIADIVNWFRIKFPNFFGVPDKERLDKFNLKYNENATDSEKNKLFYISGVEPPKDYDVNKVEIHESDFALKLYDFLGVLNSFKEKSFLSGNIVDSVGKMLGGANTYNAPISIQTTVNAIPQEQAVDKAKELTDYSLSRARFNIETNDAFLGATE